MIKKPINCTEAHVPTPRYGMVVSDLICCQTSIRRHATLFWKTSYKNSGAQSSFHQITLNKASEFTCNFPKSVFLVEIWLYNNWKKETNCEKFFNNSTFSFWFNTWIPLALYEFYIPKNLFYCYIIEIYNTA